MVVCEWVISHTLMKLWHWKIHKGNLFQVPEVVWKANKWSSEVAMSSLNLLSPDWISQVSKVCLHRACPQVPVSSLLSVSICQHLSGNMMARIVYTVLHISSVLRRIRLSCSFDKVLLLMYSITALILPLQITKINTWVQTKLISCQKLSKSLVLLKHSKPFQIFP